MNTNCLQGIKCPTCGYEDGFKISCVSLMFVTDDGMEETKNSGGYEWDDDSYCECDECGKHGTVKDFTIKEEQP